MANIRVTCPACKTELEVGAEFDGQEVECGNCLEVFQARAPGSGGSSGPSRGGPKIPGAGARPSGGSSGGGGGGGRTGSRPPSRRPAPRRRRRDDDDDDYEHDRRRDDDFDDYDPRPYRSGGEGDGAAVASLVLGIISLIFFCCWPISGPLGLIATICGAIGMKSRDNKGLAVAGLTLGILGMVMAGLTLYFWGSINRGFN